MDGRTDALEERIRFLDELNAARPAWRYELPVLSSESSPLTDSGSPNRAAD
jgi:hypothetical protein